MLTCQFSCYWTTLCPPFTLIMDQGLIGPCATLFLTVIDFNLTTRHIHNWELSAGSASFFLQLVTSSFSKGHIDTFQLGGLIPPVSHLCFFILFMGALTTRILSGLVIPSSGPYFVELHSWPIHLGWPLHGMAHSFTELYKPLATRLWFTKDIVTVVLFYYFLLLLLTVLCQITNFLSE